MSRQGIFTGTSPNDGTGDSLLSGALKVNQNFTEIYSTFGDGNNLATAGIGGTWAVNATGIHTTKNVGIGTTNATSTLTVNGSLSVNGISTFTNNVNFVGVTTNIFFQQSTNSFKYGDNARAYFGTALDLEIYSDGSSSAIQEKSGGNKKLYIVSNDLEFRSYNTFEQYLTATANSGVSLYYDASKKFETIGIGVSINGTTLTNQLNVSGVATAVAFNGQINTTNELYVSGVSTLGTVQVSSGIISATSGIVTYYGDGSNLTGVTAFDVIQQEFTLQVVYPTLANATGVNSVGISTTELVFVPSTGNLGVGTANPTSKLTVYGNGQFYGDLNVTGISTFTNGPVLVGSVTSTGTASQLLQVTGGAYVSDNLGIGTINPTSKLTVYGNSEFYGNGQFYGDLNVTGVSTFTNGPVLVGSVTPTGTVSQPLQVTGGAYVSGNLGIGTINPTSKLTVYGNSEFYGDLNVTGVSTLGTIQVSSGIISATSGIVTYYGDGSNLVGIAEFDVIQQEVISQVVYPTLANATGVNSVGISTTELVFIPSTGSIGIGTINPTSKLTVYGNGQFYGDLNVTGISTFTNGPVLVGSATSTGTLSQPLQVTGGAYVSDNLGIGTTNPTSKLTVYGNSEFYGDLNVTGVSTFTNGPVLVGSATSTGTTSQLLQVTGGAYVSGNLGIGTANPTSKLTVRNGDIRVGVNTSQGIILTDANGVAWRLFVNTNGTLGTVLV
jgi:hypothetical protein